MVSGHWPVLVAERLLTGVLPPDTERMPTVGIGRHPDDRIKSSRESRLPPKGESGILEQEPNQSFAGAGGLIKRLRISVLPAVGAATAEGTA